MDLLKFDIETWKKRPDLYPMIEPDVLVTVKKREIVKHGDILVGLADGSWIPIPEEAYKKIRREFYV